jgi:hypothetical protein
MLERPSPNDLLDYDLLAQDLGVEQAAAILMALKPTKHSALHPLKLALERRIRESPIQIGIGQLVMRKYYRRAREETHATDNNGTRGGGPTRRRR